MLKIEVPHGTAQQKSFDGRTYYVQEAYAHTGGKYPELIKLSPPMRDDGTPQPYAPGLYTLSVDSFYVRNGQLKFKARLANLPAQQKPAAA